MNVGKVCMHWPLFGLVFIFTMITYALFLAIHEFKLPYEPITVTIKDTQMEETHFRSLLHLAKRMHAAGDIPMFAMVNKAYLPMTHSWLCNTANMTGVHSRVIIVASKDTTWQELKQKWPKINVFPMPVDSILEQPLAYNTGGYRAFLLHRVQLIASILRNGIPLLLFETDAVWFNNPLRLVEHFRDKADIVGARVGGRHFHNISVNFMYLNPTRQTINSWSEMIRRLSASVTKSYEQNILDSVCKQRYDNVNCVTFAYKDIADGNWYTSVQKTSQKGSDRPFVVNNNFVIGVENKMRRAQKFQHWFVNDATKQMQFGNPFKLYFQKHLCNWNAVEKISVKLEADSTYREGEDLRL